MKRVGEVVAQEGGGGGRAAVGAVHNNCLFVDVREGV